MIATHIFQVTRETEENEDRIVCEKWRYNVTFRQINTYRNAYNWSFWHRATSSRQLKSSMHRYIHSYIHKSFVTSPPAFLSLSTSCSFSPVLILILCKVGNKVSEKGLVKFDNSQKYRRGEQTLSLLWLPKTYVYLFIFIYPHSSVWQMIQVLL